MARNDIRKAAALMGRQVVVTSILKRDPPYQKDTDRLWRAVDVKPVTGWIVGIRRLQNGRRHDGTYCGEEGYDPPTFRESAPRTVAYLVAPSPSKKPLVVPLDGWRDKAAADPPPCLSDTTPYDDAYRQMLSEEAKAMPRDASGRFVPMVRRNGRYEPRVAEVRA